MEMNKKDAVYEFLQNINRGSFADLLEIIDYVSDNLDFKETWIKKGALAKELLAMANSGGGIIVFGVKEKEDNQFDPCGLQEICDPAEVQNSVEKFIPSNLKYQVENFSFDRSEYDKLQGKKFQILIVENCPQYLPYISKNETEGLKKATIYVRRGTECTVADKDDIERLINKRLATGYKSKLEFEDHIRQLQILYRYKQPTWASATSAIAVLKKLSFSVNNQNSSEFYTYIDELVERKKKIIEMDLGLY